MKLYVFWEIFQDRVLDNYREFLSKNEESKGKSLKFFELFELNIFIFKNYH